MSSEQMQIEPRSATESVPTWRTLVHSIIGRVRYLNPYRRVAESVEEPGVYFVMAFLSVVAASLILPEMIESPILGLLIIGAVDGMGLLGSDNEEAREIDDARDLYLDGVIDLDEYEDRLDILLDEDRQELRARIESINGIGPDRSSRIVSEFGPDELRSASTDELIEIHGIGESLAVEIVSEVGR